MFIENSPDVGGVSLANQSLVVDEQLINCFFLCKSFLLIDFAKLAAGKGTWHCKRHVYLTDQSNKGQVT